MSVTEPFDPRTAPSPGTPQSVAERTETAQNTLDPDGTATAVLRALRGESAEILSYDDLSRELGLTEANRRQIALKLDLAERITYPSGGRGLSLRPAGRVYLDAIDQEISRQQSPPTTDADVISLPKSSDYRVTPRAHEGVEDSRADQSTGDRPAGEAKAVASTDDYAPKYIQPVYVDTPSAEAARAAAESGEIALVDAPTQNLKGKDGETDSRVMGWSYDESSGELTVSATYVNPCQYTTCIARALASHWGTNPYRGCSGGNLRGHQPSHPQ